MESEVQSTVTIKRADGHKRFLYCGEMAFINVHGELTLDFYEDYEIFDKEIINYTGGINELDPNYQRFERMIQTTMIITAERIPDLIKVLQEKYDIYMDFKNSPRE